MDQEEKKWIVRFSLITVIIILIALFIVFYVPPPSPGGDLSLGLGNLGIGTA